MKLLPAHRQLHFLDLHHFQLIPEAVLTTPCESLKGIKQHRSVNYISCPVRDSNSDEVAVSFKHLISPFSNSNDTLYDIHDHLRENVSIGPSNVNSTSLPQVCLSS